MRRTLVLRLLCVGVLLLATPAVAAADITAFVGLTPTGGKRALRGFAVGFGLLVVGFEFEYANTVEDTTDEGPGLQTGSGNILIQTPIEVGGISVYGTAGGGLYRERLATRQETSFGSNVGGGAKIRLVGPLRLRLDYRIFRLQGDPLHQTYQRLYAGANIGF